MKKFRTAMVAMASAGALVVGVNSVSAQDAPEIVIEELRDGLYVIYGRGGNIGMSAGEEGVFLIDDQFAPLTDAIMEAIREVNDGEVHFLINTHHHGDHTGGNENFGKMGTVIVAHDNVRGRLEAAGDKPDAAIPVITFNDQASIFINGKEARAIHFANAHTDGDSVIYFENQNLFHMGDIFFNAVFPFIDVDSGGSINGTIAVVEQILAMSNADTIIIPGHGKVTDKTGLEEYRVMLVTIRDRVKALKDEGASLEEVLAANPAAGFEDWNWGINAERVVRAIYNSL